MDEAGQKVRYLHSDIDTLERVEIIKDLRLGKFNILVGINLLREGLDIPECGLVAILDADKEGFLRSKTSLIQTIGRAARNINGRVILYADNLTNSLKEALYETERRREKQLHWNKINGIIPKSVVKEVKDIMPDFSASDNTYTAEMFKEDKKEQYDNIDNLIDNLKERMLDAAKNLDFEKAAEYRDQIKFLNNSKLGIKSKKPRVISK